MDLNVSHETGLQSGRQVAKMLLSQLVIYLPQGKGMSEFHQLSGLVGHVIGYQMRAVSFRSRQTAYPVLDQQRKSNV